jgi:hypothetical protein
MLFEYLKKELDPVRTDLVKKHLQENDDSREDLVRIEFGLNYCDVLARTRVSDAILEEINGQTGIRAFVKRYSAWKQWPATVKWGAEALVVSGVVVLVMTLIPMTKIKDYFMPNKESYLLAEYEKGDSVNENATADERLKEAQKFMHEEPTLPEPNEVISVVKKDEKKTPPLVSAIPNANPGAQSAVAIGVLVNNKLVESRGQPIQNSQTTRDMDEADVAGTAKKIAIDINSTKIVYRAFMNLANVDTHTPAITTGIEKLGGQKAGEVQLGWRKKTGSYYHFVIPRNNEKALLELLNKYAPVRVYALRHQRMVPQEQMRFVLWIEEATAKVSRVKSPEPKKSSEEAPLLKNVESTDVSPQAPTPIPAAEPEAPTVEN